MIKKVVKKSLILNSVSYFNRSKLKSPQIKQILFAAEHISRHHDRSELNKSISVR